MKNFEALTYSIGSADTQLAGYQVTRTRSSVILPSDPTAPRPTELPVESTIGFPDEGRLAVQGTLYRYTTKSDDSFLALAWFDGAQWREGIRRTHQAGEDVWDQTQTRSLLDNIKRSLFVESAQGGYLNALARNLGIKRKPWVNSDELFRRIVQAIAFSPRGSMWTIEALLKAILGPQEVDGEVRWSVWENLTLDANGKPRDAAKVFIDLGPEFVSLDPKTSLGKTFIESRTNVRMRDASSLVIPYDPLDVTSIELTPENHESPCDVVFSEETAAPLEGEPEVAVWSFDGADEAGRVGIGAEDGGCVVMKGAGQALYVHEARIDDNTIASLRAIFRMDGQSTSDDEAVFRIETGSRKFEAGVSVQPGSFTISLIGADGTPLTPNITALSSGRYVDTNLIVDDEDTVSLYVNGRLINRVETSAFATSSNRAFSFGFREGSGDTRLRFKKVQFFAESTTEYGENLTVSGSDVDLAEPLPTFAQPIVAVRASRVYSAQLLEDEDVENELVEIGPPEMWRFYPFYLSDALNIVQEYLDDTVTAAGVHAEYRVQVPRRVMT